MTDTEAVLLDTGVFTSVLKPGSDIAAKYAAEMTGRKLVISFQTEAEALYGALVGGWGSRRMRELEDRLKRAVVVPPQAELSRACSELRYDCRTVGHAFQDKRHAADLWIGATARWAGLDLITHDSAFRGLPGVSVICRV